jgi:hypothetical protein
VGARDPNVKRGGRETPPFPGGSLTDTFYRGHASAAPARASGSVSGSTFSTRARGLTLKMILMTGVPRRLSEPALAGDGVFAKAIRGRSGSPG